MHVPNRINHFPYFNFNMNWNNRCTHNVLHSATMPPKCLLFFASFEYEKVDKITWTLVFKKWIYVTFSVFCSFFSLCLHETRTCANVKFQHNNNNNLSKRRTKLNSKKIEIKTKQANNFLFLFFLFFWLSIGSIVASKYQYGAVVQIYFSWWRFISSSLISWNFRATLNKPRERENMKKKRSTNA